MKKSESHFSSDRRGMMKMLALGSTATLLGLRKNVFANEQIFDYKNGLPPVKIKSVKAIATALEGSNLVVVKVETTEAGLYGLGCATFTQRAEAVVTAVNSYLNDFCTGKDVDKIEDMWQSCYVSSYWRNGPVLNNALSGIDEALWDIKGKRANMPLYQLLGGKSRFAVDCYAHSSGRDLSQLEESVRANLERGFRHIRIQLGGYGSPQLSTKADFEEQSFGLPVESHMDSRPYLNAVPKMFEHIRSKFGDEIELLHD